MLSVGTRWRFDALTISSNATSIVQRGNAINTTLRAVQRSGVDPRGILYRCPEIHNGLPCPRQTKIKHSIQRNSAITFANTSAWGA